MGKIQKNQKGFGAIEGLLILVIVGLVSFTGWFVLHNKNTTPTPTPTPAPATTASTPTETTTTPKTTPYIFKQLGVSMDVLSGWKVTSTPTKEEGVNFYSWTVKKAGADGVIHLSSFGFRGDGHTCGGAGSLTAATIQDVSPTQNSDLTFMAWSYKSADLTVNSVEIVKSDEAIFKTTNNASATAVKNKAIKPGVYYFCISETHPGASLDLNDEAAPGFARREVIVALSVNSTESHPIRLTSKAKSYKDIKTMLTSIK